MPLPESIHLSRALVVPTHGKSYQAKVTVTSFPGEALPQGGMIVSVQLANGTIVQVFILAEEMKALREPGVPSRIAESL